MPVDDEFPVRAWGRLDPVRVDHWSAIEHMCVRCFRHIGPLAEAIGKNLCIECVNDDRRKRADALATHTCTCYVSPHGGRVPLDGTCPVHGDEMDLAALPTEPSGPVPAPSGQSWMEVEPWQYPISRILTAIWGGIKAGVAHPLVWTFIFTFAWVIFLVWLLTSQ